MLVICPRPCAHAVSTPAAKASDRGGGCSEFAGALKKKKSDNNFFLYANDIDAGRGCMITGSNKREQ